MRRPPIAILLEMSALNIRLIKRETGGSDYSISMIRLISDHSICINLPREEALL
jgi:hypothetical protein